jgi:hypothetical protein
MSERPVFAAALLAVLSAAVPSRADITWNFENIDASAGPVNAFFLGFEFFDRNINAIGTQIGTSLDLYDTRFHFGGRVEPPNGEHNVLLLSVVPNPDEPPPGAPYQFIFGFTQPVSSFSITRPALRGEPDTPFIHPAWIMEAFGDDPLTPVASAGEDRITADTLVVKHTLTVAAPRIRRVRCSSWGEGATVPGVLVDAFRLQVAVPAPGAGAVVAAWLGTPRRRRAGILPR